MNTAELLNDQFHFDVLEDEIKCHINLYGVIDENTDLSSLLKYKDKKMAFNFEKVTAINSCGIRTWVNFIKSVGNTKIEFLQCPPIVVRQMNMVPSFLGSAQVVSVFVSYVCDSCDAELNDLIQISEYKAGKSVNETITCPQCNSEEMELDGNVKQYFAFVK